MEIRKIESPLRAKVIHSELDIKRKAKLEAKMITESFNSMADSELKELITFHTREMSQKLLRMHYFRAEVIPGKEIQFKKLFELYQNYVVFLQWFYEQNPFEENISRKKDIPKYTLGKVISDGQAFSLFPKELTNSPFIGLKNKDNILTPHRAFYTFLEAKDRFLKLRDQIVEE